MVYKSVALSGDACGDETNVALTGPSLAESGTHGEEVVGVFHQCFVSNQSDQVRICPRMH